VGPPAGLRPMHPTAARELPADQRGWAFEPKWDGYRALAHVVGGGLALRSRNGVDMAGWFPELEGLAGALGGRDGVLDGEVVAVRDGRPSFEALQARMANRAGHRRGAAVTYLVFDLLWLDGRLRTGLPYAERRRLLQDLELAGPAWQTVTSFTDVAGADLLAATREQGLEGVVAKRLQSPYLPGRRTRNWLKVKHYQRETFLVGGYVPDGGQVRSLLVGRPDPDRPGRLRFAGRVDHGLVPAARRRVGELLGPLATDRSPFLEPDAALLGGRWARPGPDDPPPVFVRPELAVEVSFLGWESGRLRHPAYGGLTRLL
jgi:DNA ligase D-like protein (predicted ligase)